MWALHCPFPLGLYPCPFQSLMNSEAQDCLMSSYGIFFCAPFPLTNQVTSLYYYQTDEFIIFPLVTHVACLCSLRLPSDHSHDKVSYTYPPHGEVVGHVVGHVVFLGYALLPIGYPLPILCRGCPRGHYVAVPL